MRIAFVLDVDNRTGGTIAADRLEAGLLRQGHNVQRFAKFVHGTRSGTAQQPRSKALKIKSNLAPGFLRATVETGATQQWLKGALEDFRPDVINLHSFVMAYQSLPFSTTEMCHQIAPTVWTLHDMWTFTGRCTYNFDCRKFVSGCDDACPTWSEFPAMAPQKIQGEWQTRREVLDRCRNLAAITPSQWLAREASAGLWKNHRVEVIPHGIPLDIFRPLPREAARQALGIEAIGPVVLCGAWALADRRKALDVGLAALRKAERGPITLVSLGRGVVPWDQGPYYPLGAVDDDRLKAIAYNAADFYIHPALAEVFGLMVVESIACGTPVIAFPVGGVTDLVRPGISGWLAEESSVEALTFALREAFRCLKAGKDLRQTCRELAIEEYSADLQASRYASLYHSL